MNRMAGNATWDPGQYLAFSDHRLRAALDLLARVPVERPARVHDLGCGTGNITRIMASRWPGAEIVGVDGSEAMLDRARAEPGRITWVLGDIATWQASEPADVIYSNAALHWLGDHERLFVHLLDQLAPGGVLAVQMPLSFHAPSHELMREVLATGGAGGAPLGNAALRARYARPPVMQPAAYYAMLAPRARNLDIWKTEYLHVLEGRDAVFEWVKGTGLRPILEGLGAAERAEFESVYRKRLGQAYPPGPDGKTLYLFPRLFMVITV